MSVIASSPQQIHNSPLNTSTAKQLFSIPKAQREGLGNKAQCSVAFYDLPPVKSTRAAGFGYATKYDFTKGQTNTPAPNNYSLEGEKNKNQKRGYSFGLSREQMAIAGGMTVGDKNSPGPGAYNVREINKSHVAFTFRPKTTSDTLTGSKKVPGPGTYNLAETITKDGKYYISKYHNSGASVFAPRSQRSGLYSDNRVPGPGAYDSQGAFNTTGSYFISKFRSSLCRSFGHSERKSLSTKRSDEVPGPGSYRLPSEFGHYESKNAKSTDSASKSARSVPSTSKGSERVKRSGDETQKSTGN